MQRALFIGRSTIDVISVVEEFPERDVKVRAIANHIAPGGSALNAAVAFASLGGTASLASSLGPESTHKRLIRSSLARHKVHVQDVCADPGYEIPVSTVISTTSTSSRLVINSSSDECRKARRMPGLLSSGFDLIQLDQYERNFVFAHSSEIRSFNGPIVLDGGGWRDWSDDYLCLATIPIVSARFFPGGQAEFADRCGQLGIRRWAITMGADGVVFSDNGQTGSIPAPAVKAIDSLGSGDIFHGSFCNFYLRTRDFPNSLSQASEFAAQSFEKIGTLT